MAERIADVMREAIAFWECYSTGSADQRYMLARMRGTLDATPPISERDKLILAALSSGGTYETVGNQFGMTRQAVHLIAKKHGLCGALKKDPARRTELRRRQFYGYVPADLFRTLEKCGAVRAYNAQKSSAKQRGVGWELTLSDWWQIWQESGKWEQRGRGFERYVMARFGDVGPYARGNVKICLHTENTKESLARLPRDRGRLMPLLNMRDSSVTLQE